MAKHPNDDLFASSTMTFGQHLEELRVVIIRSLFGLVLGFLIGLALANHVVEWIKSPLTAALEGYYIDKAVGELEKDFPHQEGDEEAKKQLKISTDFMRKHKVLPEEIYLEPGELSRVMRLQRQVESDPPLFESSTAAPKDEASDEPDAEAVILGADLPAPEPVFIVTRVWRPIETIVKALNAHEVFMIWLKAAFVAGLVISSPWIFVQIWNFVAAGLYPHEQRYVHVFLPFSLLLFLAGAGMAFFFVFEPVLKFLFGFNKRMNIDPDPRISEWLSFVLILPLGFGVAFQLPLVMLFLNRIGLFSIQTYLEKWRIAILVIFVISMFLTPADPISMMLMAVPLTVLYFLGIGLCRWMPQWRNPYAEGYDPGA